jgi:hypothetical protein
MSFLLVLLSLLAPTSSQASSSSQACKQLPLADLESALGAKPGTPSGSDRDQYSSCIVRVGTFNVKLEWHQPGQPGLVADVKTGLAGAAEMMGSGGPIKLDESKDFGNIGCLRSTTEIGGQKVADTSCFMPKGYYNLSVGGGSSPVPMETVKGLLEKVAAAR